MKEPTLRQREVLHFIGEYIQTHAYPPTIREIAGYFSISVKGAHDHVLALKKKGYLKQEQRRSRTMNIITQDRLVSKTGTYVSMDMVQIPILGVVAAGRPIMAAENWDGFLTLHCSLLATKAKGTSRRDYFALRVQGDSMEGAGILDGDMAVVQKQDTLRNGEIAVVQLDDRVTLKRFFIEKRGKGAKKRIRLQPENPHYTPIYCTGDPEVHQDLRLLGRVVTIIRSY
ncbi:MAG: transcriptional repressor LexA [Treponema sp.]|jgi:repressor LexA|nr:transcriptional repressor LexA [Treponema sp.]